MYLDWLPVRLQVFSKGFLLLYTILLSVPPYQPLSTRSGSILGAGASLASPGISIGWTTVVVVRMPYIWSYVSVLPYWWDFGSENRTRYMFPVFWSPDQGAGPFPFPFGPPVLRRFRTTRNQTNTRKTGVGRDLYPSRLISSPPLYPLCHCALRPGLLWCTQ